MVEEGRARSIRKAAKGGKVGDAFPEFKCRSVPRHDCGMVAGAGTGSVSSDGPVASGVEGRVARLGGE
jgi:hypothetical protein